jgi:hypothetical protein
MQGEREKRGRQLKIFRDAKKADFKQYVVQANPEGVEARATRLRERTHASANESKLHANVEQQKNTSVFNMKAFYQLPPSTWCCQSVATSADRLGKEITYHGQPLLLNNACYMVILNKANGCTCNPLKKGKFM